MKTTQEKINRGYAALSLFKKIMMWGITLTVGSAAGAMDISFRIDHLKHTHPKENK